MLQLRTPESTWSRNETTLERRAERILSLVLRHGNLLDDSTPPAHHLGRIRRALERGETLDLVLPAFPAKSPNREKTIGALPDYAEVLGLERLQETCDAIRTLHAPGARVVICSDGRVFSDLVQVSDEEVTAYGQAVRSILREEGFASLASFSMEDVFSGGGDFETMRARLTAEFGRSLEEIRADVLARTESRVMFNGIHRFMFEDRLALEPGKSRNRVREESKEVAYKVIQRSNAWSALVERFFPHALRLSIHPQFAASGKIGFRLVDCENIWGTPWHNVALLGPRGFRLVKRREAEESGAVMALARGKYAYYREAGL